MDIQEFVKGCTFDDFLFVPQHGLLWHRNPNTVDLSARFSEHLTLKRPLVSANMDTITRAAMAVALAEEGGIGIVDRGFRSGDIQPQVNEVETVKRTQHGIVTAPHTISRDRHVGDAVRLMDQVGVGTLAVVDSAMHLEGLLTERDIRFVGPDVRVSERMTPRDRLIVQTGSISLSDAEQVMASQKVKKLPIIDCNGVLLGLITAKDLLKHKRHPFATRDSNGRLCVGAAIGATGDYLERAAELLRVGADVLVIDIAHGHSRVMEHAIEELRKRFNNVELIAGNVATHEGAQFLADRGVNGIKVGIGPGGGCSTRVATNFGIAQIEAIVQCRLATKNFIPIIADGGIKRDGNIVEALLFGGDSVMLGSVFAGTEETPGEVILKAVLDPETQKMVKVPFKVFRGMASAGAVRDRHDIEEADLNEMQVVGAEGIELSVPVRGSVRIVIRNIIKHLCSAVSYGGANSLQKLCDNFWSQPERYLSKLSSAARVESFQR